MRWLVWELAEWYSRVQQRAGLLRQHGSRACHVHLACTGQRDVFLHALTDVLCAWLAPQGSFREA